MCITCGLHSTSLLSDDREEGNWENFYPLEPDYFHNLSCGNPDLIKATEQLVFNTSSYAMSTSHQSPASCILTASYVPTSNYTRHRAPLIHMFVPSTLNVLYFWTPSHTVTQVNIRKCWVHVCAFLFLFIVYGVWVLVLKGLCCYKETLSQTLLALDTSKEPSQ